jgi:hypothetical protein
LESIDTSLWSILIFIFNTISLLGIFTLFAKPRLSAALVIALFWLSTQVLFSLYGYYTGQIGFLLMGVFNVVIAFLGTILKAGHEDED